MGRLGGVRLDLALAGLWVVAHVVGASRGKGCADTDVRGARVADVGEVGEVGVAVEGVEDDLVDGV